MNINEMVDKFQCPGCVSGPNSKDCPEFSLEEIFGEGCQQCRNHCAGTIMGGFGYIQLGLPKGFNRLVKPFRTSKDNYSNIRLHITPETYEPDSFNVAVWAMEMDGFLFVRTYSPRVDATFVDVIQGGTLDMVPEAIDVGEFIDEID